MSQMEKEGFGEEFSICSSFCFGEIRGGQKWKKGDSEDIYFSISKSSNSTNSKKRFRYNSFRSESSQTFLISSLSISAFIFSNFSFLTLFTIDFLSSSVKLSHFLDSSSDKLSLYNVRVCQK